MNQVSKKQRSRADNVNLDGAVSGGNSCETGYQRRVLLKEHKVIEDLSGGIGVEFNRDLISEASVYKVSVERGGKLNPVLSVSNICS